MFRKSSKIGSLSRFAHGLRDGGTAGGLTSLKEHRKGIIVRSNLGSSGECRFIGPDQRAQAIVVSTLTTSSYWEVLYSIGELSGRQVC